MKALVYTGPEEMEYRDVADAVPTADHHLIQISSVGICGSDMHAFLGHDDRRPAPLILGHEGAGTVVDGPLDGMRVTINPLVTCRHCPACAAGRENLCSSRQIISMPPREGAFAQFVAMPKENLVQLPDGFDFVRASLAEPISVSWHAIRLGLQNAYQDMRENALVLGAGAIGVAAVYCLLAQGVRDITLVDSNARRRTYLSKEKDYTVLAPEKIDGKYFDIVVDAVGVNATRASAALVVNPGGVILHIGLGGGNSGLDIRRMTLQEVTFIGTYTYTAQDFREACSCMFDGRLGALDWTDVRPMSEGLSVFREILDGRVSAPKIILQPD
ncbi:MAG: alcohol dehydrogenase catalytic domain-containing protein [Aestuariivita sp.]|nr:alcohol dehydrogenase catalytic domain-containing protein [Aestuariivita sp.]